MHVHNDLSYSTGIVKQGSRRALETADYGSGWCLF